MKHNRILLIGSLCMICLIAAVMPVAAAPVSGTAWNTNPEHITAMQAFVAYAGTKGQAQMDGAISYIGTISNGAGKALLASVNASVMAQSGTIQTLENTWWTDRQTARMDEFSTNDQRRTGVLSNLTAKGIDVSQAQSIEPQIQQEGTALNAALTSRDESAIKAANEQLATLNKQFIDIVKGYRAQHASRPTATTTVSPTATV